MKEYGRKSCQGTIVLDALESTLLVQALLSKHQHFNLLHSQGVSFLALLAERYPSLTNSIPFVEPFIGEVLF